MPEPNDIPQVKDRRSPIAGLLPKNTQALLLGGVALVMIIVMALTGNKPSKPVAAAAPAASVIDPSQSRIQEYRQRLEEQTRQLALEEARLTKTKEALTSETPSGTTNALTGSGRYVGPTGIPYSAESGRWVERTPANNRSDIENDKARREYQSLFSSNIALTYRPPAAEAAAETIASRAPATGATGPSGRTTPTAVSDGKDRVLYEGTILETVLTNRLDSSFSGPVNCMVTTNVYSPEGPTLVIPQGTRILGEVKKLDSLGQQRLAVVFHRLIRPDGSSVSLDQFQGLSQIGETGLRDQVNHHYLQIFGASLAIGAVAGLAQANSHYGTTQSAADTYEQGVTSSLAQSSLHTLDRYLNVLPTFTIREGQRVKVYLSQDLRLPPYDERKDLQ